MIRAAASLSHGEHEALAADGHAEGDGIRISFTKSTPSRLVLPSNGSSRNGNRQLLNLFKDTRLVNGTLPAMTQKKTQPRDHRSTAIV